jgi:hypothetical protein
MSEWKPIKTAPKDDTRMLFYYGNFGTGLIETGFGWQLLQNSFPGDVRRPTHWMPLPEPPPCE